VSLDPLALAPEIEAATKRLLRTAAGLSDDAAHAPSALPGWTRGHVLTHVARNADGLVNLLTWARTGVETPMYASAESRDADIEAGAGRSAGTLVADVTDAAGRLATAMANLPSAAWTATVRWRNGAESPAARIPWARLLEVELHHVDLDTGYRPEDWPEAFADRLYREAVHALRRRPETPPLVLHATDFGHDEPIGDGEGAPRITGGAAALGGWLTGRTDGAELTVDPPGPLPTLPVWL